MKRIWKNIILIGFAMALCILATGCMGGKKDITKEEEAVYTEMIMAACSEYGYEYEQHVVLPKGSALCYVLSDGDEGLDIRVTINEESTYEFVGCEFELERTIADVKDNTAGLDQHIPVLVKITEHFTDEITAADVTDYLNDDSLWVEGKDEDEPFMHKDTTGNLIHTIEPEDEGYEEYFYFSWDNGKEYKLRKDK